MVMLAGSATMIAVAPSAMPDGYSWIVHTTSESAAQNLEGAWIARLGFLTFGLAVLWLASASATVWARGVVWLHLGFGVLMVSTAVFSHRPWLSGVPFDPMEDHLHSWTATLMGFAFALGVFLRLLQRWGKDQRRGPDRRGVVLDCIALLSATLIPLMMLFQPDTAGLAQRLMFLVAYTWYGVEALSLHGGASARMNLATEPGGTG